MVGTYAEQWPERKGQIGAVPLEALECNQGGNSRAGKRKEMEAKGSKFASFYFLFISFYYPESGLFKQLRAKEIKKFRAGRHSRSRLWANRSKHPFRLLSLGRAPPARAQSYD